MWIFKTLPKQYVSMVLPLEIWAFYFYLCSLDSAREASLDKLFCVSVRITGIIAYSFDLKTPDNHGKIWFIISKPLVMI